MLGLPVRHLSDGDLLDLQQGAGGPLRRWWLQRHLRRCDFCVEKESQMRNLCDQVDAALLKPDMRAVDRLDTRNQLLRVMRSWRWEGGFEESTWHALAESMLRCLGSKAVDSSCRLGPQVWRRVSSPLAVFVGRRNANSISMAISKDSRPPSRRNEDQSADV